jgi:hypothetical protein
MGDAIKKAATTSAPIVERSNFFILNSLLYLLRSPRRHWLSYASRPLLLRHEMVKRKQRQKKQLRDFRSNIDIKLGGD